MLKVIKQSDCTGRHNIDTLWDLNTPPLHVVDHHQTLLVYNSIDMLASQGVEMLQQCTVDQVTQPPKHHDHVMYAAPEAACTIHRHGVRWTVERYGKAWLALSTVLVVGRYTDGHPILATLLVIRLKDKVKTYLFHCMWRSLYTQERRCNMIEKRLDDLKAIMGEAFVWRSAMVEYISQGDDDDDTPQPPPPLSHPYPTPISTENVWSYWTDEVDAVVIDAAEAAPAPIDHYTEQAAQLIQDLQPDDDVSPLSTTPPYQQLSDEQSKRFNLKHRHMTT